MRSFPRTLVGLCLVTACGFPRPADVPGPADDGGVDASGPSRVTVQVSNAGDDANDGMSKPVKTLKRAIAIAGTNTEITTIVLAAGRYVAGSGETFPYLVPANVTIVGPMGGGAILVGTRTENGLTIDTGKLQDLELEDFQVAITGTGAALLTNLKVRTSMLAIRGETTARLIIDNLDIVGSVDACGSGVVLKGSADLLVTTLVTRGLQSVLVATEPSTTEIRNADITGDPRCVGGAFSVSTGKIFKLSDSIVVGYYNGILSSGGSQSPTQLSVTRTTFRNITSLALSGGSGVVLNMIGGAFLNNSRATVEVIGGMWNFANVLFQGNEAPLYIQGTPSEVALLTMRGCTITGNSYGISLSDRSAADLGTSGSPGNNTFQGNLQLGISLQGVVGVVNAVGNIWNPGVQGADSNGRYLSSTTINGPIAAVVGNNYAIFDGSSLQR